jgi:hypothetical protein
VTYVCIVRTTQQLSVALVREELSPEHIRAVATVEQNQVDVVVGVCICDGLFVGGVCVCVCVCMRVVVVVCKCKWMCVMSGFACSTELPRNTTESFPSYSPTDPLTQSRTYAHTHKPHSQTTICTTHTRTHLYTLTHTYTHLHTRTCAHLHKLRTHSAHIQTPSTH